MWSAVVWSAYVGWRTPAWGLLSGLPLSPLATVAILIIWWTWWVRRELPAARWLTALLALKIAVGLAVVPYGFSGAYFSNDSWSGPPERGLFSPSPGDTRIDEALAFGGPNPDLPLFYLNDLLFNSDPHRDLLGYSARWSGFLSPDANIKATVYLTGRGVSGEVTVDGFQCLVKRAEDDESRGSVDLRRGIRHVEVRVAGAYGAPRAFEVGLVDSRTDARTRLGGPEIVAWRVPVWRHTLTYAVNRAATGVDLIVLASLCWCAALAIGSILKRARKTPVAALSQLAPLVAIGAAVWLALPTRDHLILLGAGSDWLTYESYARDIALNGPLMTQGAAVGHGSPYYFQILYPYVLALLHLLLGESLFGIYLVQWLLLALSAAIIGSLTTTLFGQGIGAAGFIAALAFNLSLTSRWTVELASENLFIPLLCLWTLWLTREIDKPGTQTIAGGAVLLGFTTLARSTLLTAWPFSFWALFAAYRRARRPLKPLLVLALLACATLGTATVRNWIVSHQLTPLSTSGSVALLVGNPIPPDVPQHAHDEDLFYRWVASDSNVRTTLEFARHAPARFLRGLLDKTMYGLGWFGVIYPGAPREDRLVIVWVLALVGVAVWKIAGVRDGSPALARAVPGLIAGCHFLTMVAILPWANGDRLLLPAYLLIVPYAAIAPGRVVMLLAGRAARITSNAERLP